VHCTTRGDAVVKVALPVLDIVAADVDHPARAIILNPRALPSLAAETAVHVSPGIVEGRARIVTESDVSPIVPLQRAHASLKAAKHVCVVNQASAFLMSVIPKIPREKEPLITKPHAPCVFASARWRPS